MDQINDMEPIGADEPVIEPVGPGAQLRIAREAAGLSLDDIGAETRVPIRHLELIEAEAFDELPARTYAIGFSRSYAKAVGLDQNHIAELVRSELAASRRRDARLESNFEPGDPARVPSGKLGLFSLAAIVLLLAGLFVFYRTFFAPAGELPPLTQNAPTVAANPTIPLGASPSPKILAVPAGPVVFTALEDNIWVKFYEANGTQLMQKQMAKGEQYTVPVDASAPLLWTGRPDALAIAVGGKPVARLADEPGIMKDIAVTPAALAAREGSAAVDAPVIVNTAPRR